MMETLVLMAIIADPTKSAWGLPIHATNQVYVRLLMMPFVMGTVLVHTKSRFGNRVTMAMLVPTTTCVSWMARVWELTILATTLHIAAL
jgi:hypothetical protein